MADERVDRVVAALRELGADWAVLTSMDAVAYATGHAPIIEAGPSPFGGGPAVALVGGDGQVGLLAASAAATRADAVETYDAYGSDHADAATAAYEAALRRLAATLGVGGMLTAEPATHTALLDAVLGTARIDVTPALRQQRMTKTTAELAALRRVAAITATGQRAFAAALAAGRSELALFADIRRAMEEDAGERLPVGGDLISGVARTAAIGGWPGSRVIQPGDAVIADLGPRFGGYWGDSCATIVVGEASEAQLRLFTAARSALEHAMSVMRPGLAVSALHEAVRGCVRGHGFDYPHHTGHSIGTAVHEYPRVTAREQAALQAGMVLMIEPGAYDPAIGGVRTEWMIQITETGCDAVEPFPLFPS